MTGINLYDEKDVKLKWYKDGQVTCEWVNTADEDVILYARGNSYSELFAIAAVTDHLKYWDQRLVKLSLVGLIGMRSDRRFNDGSHDIKVITNFINSLGWNKHDVFAPHSDVTITLLNNGRAVGDDLPASDKVRVFPDAGSAKRYEATDNDIVCSKIRHPKTGDPAVMLYGACPVGSDLIIVDDYCDGGRTFINTAKELYESGAKSVSLWVSHGLFSYGLKPLKDAGIKSVRCTNSLGVDYSKMLEEAGSDFTLRVDKVI